MSDQNRETRTPAITSSQVAKAVSAVAAGVVGATCSEEADAAPVLVPVLETFTVTERDHEEMLLTVRRPRSMSVGLQDFISPPDDNNSISQIFLSMQTFFDSTTMGGVFIDRTLPGGNNASFAKSFDFTELIPASTSVDAPIDSKASLNDFFNAGGPRIAGFTFADEQGQYAALMVLEFSGDTDTGEGAMFIDRIVYESDPGVPLPASAANIPEPGSAALAGLAAGAAALGVRRRVRKKPESATA